MLKAGKAGRNPLSLGFFTVQTGMVLHIHFRANNIDTYYFEIFFVALPIGIDL